MPHLFNETGHASQDDRNQEAERLIDELSSHIWEMNNAETKFVEDMVRKKEDGDLFCTPKILFWLRDLYGRYCV